MNEIAVHRSPQFIDRLYSKSYFKDSILVHLGCGNKLPETGWFLNSRDFSQF